MKSPNPFIEFPDMANMTDRQLVMLCLFEIIELKAELRALSGLNLGLRKALDKPVSSEQFDTLVNTAQDGAIAEMIQHAKALMQSPQQPEKN